MKFLSDILARAGLVVEGAVTLNGVANATTDTDRFLVLDSGVVRFRTGAQILSDTGGALDSEVVHIAGTETVTGSKTFSAGISLGTVVGATGVIRNLSTDGSLVMGGSAFSNPSLPARTIIISTVGTYSALTGAANLFVGRNAGASVTSGNNNVFIGKGAGSGITTGAANVLMSSSDASNLPSALSNSIHLVAGGGYRLNDASSIPTTAHVFIGGGFGSSTALRDFYFGQLPFTPDAGLVQTHITFYAPSGSGTDIPGSNFTIAGGRGTGAGTPGSVIISTSAQGASGSAVQTLVERARFNASGLTLAVITAATTDTDAFLVSDGGVVKFRTGAQLLSDIGAQAAGSFVPTTRTLTINGTTFDLSADRSWSITAGVSSVNAGSGISVSSTTGAVTVSNTGILSAVAGSGISVSTSGGTLSISNTGLLSALAGSGISVSTSGGTLSISNTGILSGVAGSGISVSTSGGTLSISNTGLLSATAGSGISVSTSGGTVSISNTGVLSVVAGSGISVSTSGGTVTVSNTITNNNQLTNGAGYITGYTETDTLATVTARGASTSTAVSFNGGLSATGVATFTRSGRSIFLNPNLVDENTTALIDVTSGMALALGVGGTARLTIASTGAATFSGDVSSNGTGSFNSWVQATDSTGAIARAQINGGAGRIVLTDSRVGGIRYDLGCVRYGAGTFTINDSTSVGAPVRFAIFNTGNVFIGFPTSDLGYRLQVDGTAYISSRTLLGTTTDNGVDRLQVSGSVSVSTSLSLGDGFNLTWGGAYGAGIPTIASAIGSGIFFYPNGSTSGATMRVTPGGNFLVGTTTDGVFRFDVVSLSAPIARFTGATNGYIDISDGIVNSRIQNSGGLFIGTTTSHDLNLRTNATTRLTILASTGAATFSSSVTAGGTVTATSSANSGLIAATNSTTGYAYLDLINNGASGRNYQIGVGGNSTASAYANNLYFDLVGVGSIMTLTSGRNVGIGTTSPLSLLDVNGNVYFRSDLRFGSSFDGASNNTAIIKWQGSGALIPNSLGIFTWADGRDIQIGGSNVLFRTESGTERMRITNGGNVGIGTTSPGSRLTVNGAIESLIDSGSEGGQIILRAQSGGPRRWNIDNWSTSSTLRFFIEDDATTANGVVLMSITTSGQVRFGNYTSSSSFTGTAVATLAVDSSGNVITVAGGGGSSQWVTTGSDIYYATGNVGIGSTASPTTRLDVRLATTDSVAGTVLSSYPIASFIANGSGGGTRGLQIGAPTGGIASPVFLKVFGTSARFAILNQSNVENFTVLEGGNVGINSTNPGSRLSIVGSNTGTVPLLDLQASGTGTFQRGVRLLNSGMAAGDHIMYAVGQADSSRNMGQFYFQYNGAGSTSNRISLGLHSVDDVFNILGTGNVGIGTVSPGARLHVVTASSGATAAGNAIAIFENNVNGVVQINGPDSSSMGLFFGRSGAAYYSGIERTGTDLLLKNANTVAVTIASSLAVTFASSITCTSLTETSSIKIKENIAPVTAALDKVDQLKPVSYNKKGSTTKEIGLIAEDVFDVYPEFVLCDDNGEPVGVHYSRLTAVLIESVKELKKEINELKNRN